jgi:DNA-directed RNA polymerase specialized sigma24 family protein
VSAIDRAYELLHLALRDVEQLVDSLLEHLLPMARELANDRWRHAEELVVERLARVLVALGGVIPRVAFDAA